jgi:hypothetical protein
MVEVAADASAAQGTVVYQTSADQASWDSAGEWPLYPSTTMELGLPRFARYARVLIRAAPVLGGTVSGGAYARATLAEVLQTYAVSSATAQTSFAGSQNVPANITLYSRNLAMLDLAMLFTAIQAGSVVQVSGSNDGMNYAQLYLDSVPVAGRWQRTVEYPLAFLNITVSNSAGAAQTTGTLFYRPGFVPAPPQYLGQVPVYASDGSLVALGSTSDVAGTGTAIGQLKTIASASSVNVANIGTQTDTVNASYQGTVIAELHEILNALIQGGALHGSVDGAGAGSVLGQLRSIAASVLNAPNIGTPIDFVNASYQGTVIAELHEILNALIQGGALHGSVDAAGAASVVGQLRSIAASDSTIATNTGATATNTGTIAANTGTIATNTGTIATNTTRNGATMLVGAINVPASTWTDTGMALSTSNYIVYAQLTTAAPAASGPLLTAMGFGGPAANVFLYGYVVGGTPLVFNAAGQRNAGVSTQSSINNLWIYCQANTNVAWNVAIVP